MKHQPALHFLAAATWLVACSTSVWSAEAAKPTAKPAPAVTTPGAGGTMSRDELKACLDEEASLRNRRVKLDQDARSIDQLRVSIEKDQSALQTGQSQVDTRDEKAVQAFNQRAQELNQRANEYNTQANALNTSSNELQDASKRYASHCADRSYLPGDREAILRQRGTAASGLR